MGNFMSDVGRSNISGSIRDLITSKIALDTNERADVRSANESALNAEQVIQAKRQNEAAAEKVKYDNTPLAINSFSDSIEGGPEGPIFKHLYSKAKAQGLIDESNPNNPTIKRKHINEDMKKIFAEDAMQINTMRIDMLNSQKQALLAEKSKKPDDEKINASIESINVKLNQATMHDDGLKKMAELNQKTEEAKLKEEGATARNLETTKTAAEGHRLQLQGVLASVKERETHLKSQDPTYKMPPKIKLAFDWIKAFQSKTQPSSLLLLLAGQGNAEARADIQKMQDFGKDPENQRLALKYNKMVEEYISGPQAAPEGVRDEDIRHTMKLHNMTYDEVVSRLRK